MSEEEAPPRPLARRKKKRKRPAEEPAEIDRAEAEAEGEAEAEAEEKPAFAASYPEDAELARIVALFEAGHYADVRVAARKLVHATEDDDVRSAARDLLARLEPDPIAKALLIGAGILLAFLAAWFWTHRHL